MRSRMRFLPAITGLTVILDICLGIKLAAATDRNILILVNGWNNCCAVQMSRLRDFAWSRGMEVQDKVWCSYRNKSCDDDSPHDNAKTWFVTRGKMDLYRLGEAGRRVNVFFVGHSWGADAVVRLVNAQRPHPNVRYRLVATIDQVGGNGRRSPRSWRIPSYVEYFFNRWQTVAAWPRNFTTSGRAMCSARTCNQRLQNVHRNRNGSIVKIKCSLEHRNCLTPKNITAYRGRPILFERLAQVVAGTPVPKRVSHQGMPYDAYIQQQLINVLDGILPPCVRVGDSTRCATAVQMGNTGSGILGPHRVYIHTRVNGRRSASRHSQRIGSLAPGMCMPVQGCLRQGNGKVWCYGSTQGGRYYIGRDYRKNGQDRVAYTHGCP